MIKLEHLTKNYNNRTVLSIDSLELELGKRYALIGANGSGKSTFLKLMAKTLKQDNGSIHLKKNCKIGYMPQVSYGFSFSVQKNVMLAVKKESNRKERVDQALESVALGALAHKNAASLSGGEMQRMALARIFAGDFELLLLDEPTSSCDIASVDFIETALLRYCIEAKRTLIFSTHSPVQAKRLSEITIFLDGGKVIEMGSTKKLIDNPSSDTLRMFLKHWRM